MESAFAVFHCICFACTVHKVHRVGLHNYTELMGILNENEVICSRGSSANPWNLAQERIEELDPRQGKSGSTPSHLTLQPSLTLMLWQVKWPKKASRNAKRYFMGMKYTKKLNRRNKESPEKLQSSFCWQCFLTVQLLRFDVLDVLDVFYSVIPFSIFQSDTKALGLYRNILYVRLPRIHQFFRF